MPRLGRLFWKFFAFFWLAQMATSLVVGLLFWSLRAEHGNEPPPWEIAGNSEHMRPAPPPPRGPPQPRGPLPPVAPVIAGTLVSFVFAAWLAWYFSRPIRILRDALESAAKGQLTTRVDFALGGRRDELADLGTAFDRMAEQLESLIGGQRRLLHDVSHELRSPLARLQAASALIAQTPARAVELLPRLEIECQRIDRLVDELLTLARVDAGMAGKLDEPNDLVELLGELAEDAQLEGTAKQVDIALSCSVATAPVHCNRELLLRALGNVTRNAVKYGPAKSTIEIGLVAVAEGWQIEVCDAGPGIPDAEITTLFEPFVRGCSGHNNDGYGLGLAITRRIVLAHGGTVSAHNRTSGGLCVRCCIPEAD